MSDRVIDARSRFRREPPKTGADHAEQESERLRRQRNEAEQLREKLVSTPRLDPADRKVISRNLGRSIERKENLNRRKICSQLFRTLYSAQGAESKYKKRKRYIRFDGEALEDSSSTEEYAASGPEFLRLIEGLASIMDANLPSDQAKDQMLLSVCNGTSLYGPERPRLVEARNLPQKFRVTIDAVIDRIVRETDIVSYFDEIRDYNIIAKPSNWNEMCKEEIDNLHFVKVPCREFEHVQTDNKLHYDEYTRLRLGGFDVHAESPSPLYPSIRFARIFLPRPVLCLPASVPTEVLERTYTGDLTDEELSVGLAIVEKKTQTYKKMNEMGKRIGISNYDIGVKEYRIIAATEEWRKFRAVELWSNALREAGIDPENIDWSYYVDETDMSAANGAKWHRFWRTINVDLYVIAEGNPENIDFGLSFGGIDGDAHWSDACRDLINPSDDGEPWADINCSETDIGSGVVAWMPYHGRSHVCRAYYIENEDLELASQFEEIVPELWDALATGVLWPLQEKETWEFLTTRMEDWRNALSDRSSDQKDENELMRLRPLFDVPMGWTPAPDGSIASAILRSLAYGEGEQRLDSKIIAAVNNHVRCFKEMKERLAEQFKAALERHGYSD